MNQVEWFVCGLLIGYFWHPVWHLAQRVIQEAKIAKQQWRKPVDREKNE